MIRFFITYKMDGLTEYSSACGVMDSFATKVDAQRALQEMKRSHPDLKGWRIIRGRI